jgi:uncharacterized protein YbaA (DUF1428 family)
MSFIDGFVVPVGNVGKEAYREHAAAMAKLFREWGATRVVEAWGEDVPEGVLTSFTMAVKREEGESVVFSWIEWPDRATRDAGWQKMMADESMKGSDMPFDGKRVIWGGFSLLLDA